MKLKPVFLLLTLNTVMNFAYAGEYEDGMVAFHAGDYKQAIAIFKPIAEEGDEDAQVKLGLMHANGMGTKRNGGEALKWFKKAAEKGNVIAEYNIGKIYATPNPGVNADVNESIKWYRLAAEKGYPDAQYALGALYFKGEGLPMDYVMGYAWMDLAAQNGHFAAPNYRDLISLTLNPEDLEKAKTLSSELAKK